MPVTLAIESTYAESSAESSEAGDPPGCNNHSWVWDDHRVSAQSRPHHRRYAPPGQARLLIAPGSGVLDGGVPVDIKLELIPADLRAEGQMVVAVYDQDGLTILAVEPYIYDNPFKNPSVPIMVETTASLVLQ